MAPIDLTWNEALSGVFGSISLAAWIFLLVPQLIENYTNGHADGISLTFLFIWFVGDITNFAGAIWAGLVPTVIALAVYFCIADLVLISQCLYYLGLKKKQEKKVEAREEGTEQTPLLNGHAAQNGAVSKSPKPSQPKRRLTDVTEENLGLPGSRRTSRASLRRMSTNEGRDSLERILEEPTRTRAIVKNTVSFLGVCAVGAAGWAIAWKTGAWRPTPVGEEGDSGETPIGAEILGYISAVCYLGARIPQIIKNQRERSCDGLSLLFFMLSLLGNLTYGAGILFHSLERQYVITNTPWLIGSLGTIVEDAIIFIQFHAFGEKAEATAAVV
ncbi:putative vacuolar amino acid transporter YPQ1 [Pseudocercospora fuligena]|uniref:Putative vacuolar amino acid transporter YPQ1 n=1 Tax=Pseudocercospora fuligena TaxID=685502 RepID=A0A8H6RIK9_9PEZI|nr:putative vacuolar amino acid transporter YPQ1 [Pseudocercospora fuligena]